MVGAVGGLSLIFIKFRLNVSMHAFTSTNTEASLSSVSIVSELLCQSTLG